MPARIVVFAVNRGYKPRDALHLREALRVELGGVPVNVRVASRHVEISAVADERSLAAAVSRIVGPVVDLGQPVSREPLERYLWFLVRERFWEAHEVLEPLWRSSRDPGLQALILLAAALAKAQEGSLKGALRNASHIPRQALVDRECVVAAVEAVLAGVNPHAEKCVRLRG